MSTAPLIIPGAAPDGTPRSRSPAIELDHLARQTMGDKDVARDVLVMFAGLARACMDELRVADEAGCEAIAHRLLGSARGVGAFAVADAAEALKSGPEREAGLAALAAAVLEAESFIREHCG